MPHRLCEVCRRFCLAFSFDLGFHGDFSAREGNSPRAIWRAESNRIAYAGSTANLIMANATVLVVDDEDLIRWSLRERLRTDGYEVLEAGTGRAALEQFKEGVDLVLLDYRLPDTDGLSVLRELKKLDPDILVILLTSFVSVDTAVEAMKLGAFHFANKPFDLDDVAALVGRALETTRLRREVKQLRENEARPYSLRAIVGESEAMEALRQMVAKVA